MTPFDLHLAEDHATVQRNIDSKNIDRPNTYVHLTNQGRRIDVEILADQIDYQGRPAWIGIVRDITARKRGRTGIARQRGTLSQSSGKRQRYCLHPRPDGNMTSITRPEKGSQATQTMKGLKMNIFDSDVPEQAEKSSTDDQTVAHG